MTIVRIRRAPLGCMQIVAIVALTVALGCSPRKKGQSDLKDQTQTWADVPVTLGKLDEPYMLVLQSFAPAGELTGDSKFAVFAVREREGEEGKRHGVYYVDRNPEKPDALQSFTYQLQTHVFQRGVVDVYAWLYKQSPAHNAVLASDPSVRGQYSEAQRVFLGRAQYQYTTQRLARLSMPPRLNGSKSYLYSKGFTGDGHIAIHYVNNVVYEEPRTNPDCEGKTNCSSLPLETVCRNSILTPGCRPPAPPKSEHAAFAERGKTEGLQAYGEGVYLLPRGAAPGKITFVSRTMKATAADNQKSCDDLVTFMVREGRGEKANAACRVKKIASETPEQGMLACSIQISFEEPKDVGEFGCNVTALVRGPTKEYQTLQVLYGNK